MKKMLLIIALMVSVNVSGGNLADVWGLPFSGGIYTHHEYTISYNYDLKIPNWVAYNLSAEELNFKRKRKGSWKYDSLFSKSHQASNKDYYKSGYDKGHLLPSADMVKSEEAMRDTFLFSNAAPQIGNGFNRTIWMYLEKQVRKWAKESGSIWVYTGVYFVQGRKKEIGDNVYVPHYWYKIVFRNSPEPSVQAFVFRNKKYEYKDFYRNQTTVDFIEKKTGLDFLSRIPDDVENKIESKRVKW